MTVAELLKQRAENSKDETPHQPAVHVAKESAPVPVVIPPLGYLVGATIEFIVQRDQRYDTIGDWVNDNGVLSIKITEFEDPRISWAVAIHELIEAVLCTQKGITQEEVDKFDMGQGATLAEPGMHPMAPYHKEHILATHVERKVIEALGLKWEEYDKMVQDTGKEVR